MTINKFGNAQLPRRQAISRQCSPNSAVSRLVNSRVQLQRLRSKPKIKLIYINLFFTELLFESILFRTIIRSVSPFHSNLFPTCESNLEESYCFCYVPENKYALCLFTDKKIGIGRLTNVLKPIIPPGENERVNLVKELQEKIIPIIIRLKLF